ncbi:MAG: hypothetical protein K0U15_01380 [Proteobacteria bacterium]|nr:hypothetical protein [Pseudomonadota bacterium]
MQDWASDKGMRDMGDDNKIIKALGYDPERITNINLIKFLCCHLNLRLKDTYVTNLFPYVKMGEMSANIPIGDMRKAATEFSLPMIEIIEPKIVIALGIKTFNALRQSCSKDKIFFNTVDAFKKCLKCKRGEDIFSNTPSAMVSK